MRNQIGWQVEAERGPQLGAWELLRLLWILSEPFGQVAVCGDEAVHQVALLRQKFYARCERRRHCVLVLDEDRATGFALEPRDPRLDGPHRVESLAHEQRKLIG